MADQVLYSGVACITDLMVKEGLINLDFADVRSIMSEMGKAMMGTGEATGERRAVLAAEAAIANPLLDETSMKGARGLLISITGGNDLTLYEVDEAASRIRQEVDEEANIILGATFDSALDGVVRVSVVATGIDQATISQSEPVDVLPADRSRPRIRRARAPRPVRPVAGRRPVEALSAGAPVVDDVEIQPVAPAAVASPSRSRRAAGAGGAVGSTSSRRRRSSRSSAPPRMPQIEDLPQVGPESAARASRRCPAPPAAAPETRRRSLLEKLAAFGITRHDEEPRPDAGRAGSRRPRRRRTPPRSAALTPNSAGLSRGRSRRRGRAGRARSAWPGHPRALRSPRTTSSISRRFCGGSRTDLWRLDQAPAAAISRGRTSILPNQLVNRLC